MDAANNALMSPAPWKWERNYSRLRDASGRIVMLPKDGDTDPQKMANAEAIESSPMLLAALRELLTARDYVLRCGGDILTSSAWALAEKAITRKGR